MTQLFPFFTMHHAPLKLLLILFIGLSLPLINPATASAENKPAPVILVSGDSLSAGFGMKTSASWVALMQKRLQQEGFPHRVINASISGETSSGGLSRLPQALATYQPRIVLIELGANDGLRGLPLQNLRKNLSQMILTAQRHKAHVLLLGMKLPPNYGPLYAQEFAQLFSTLSRQHNTALVPFLLDGIATQRDLIQSDGLHPTAAAQNHILETVWPKLKPLLHD